MEENSEPVTITATSTFQTKKQFARTVQMSPRTVGLWLVAGLPHLKPGPRKILIETEPALASPIVRSQRHGRGGPVSNSNVLPPPVLSARLATLDAMLAPGGIIPLHFNPPPSKRQLARLFKSAGLSKLKANPGAKRGGGVPYYHVSQVEKLLRSRMGAASPQ